LSKVRVDDRNYVVLGGGVLVSRKILYIVNAAEYFVSHRLCIAKKAMAMGYDVHVASHISSNADIAAINVIKENGLSFHDLPIMRGGQNPLVEIVSIFKTYLLMRRLHPDLVHLVTIKPVLYGGIAARMAGVESVVAAIAGLGTVFISETLFSKFRRWLVSCLLGFALNKDKLVAIFQNADDRDALLGLGVLDISQARIIRGSGVDIVDYPYVPEPVGKPVVVMVARLLGDKGVLEFVEAARTLHERGIQVDMRLIGEPDLGNPSSVSAQDMERWAADGSVSLLGFQKDIAKQYAGANIACLPSYREGLPKSLVEAAACGRAVVTTDVPGCRDAIIPNVTGYLVSPKNSRELADALQVLVERSDIRAGMGEAGRKLAEECFDVDKIVNQHILIYKEMLVDD